MTELPYNFIQRRVEKAFLKAGIFHNTCMCFALYGGHFKQTFLSFGEISFLFNCVVKVNETTSLKSIFITRYFRLRCNGNGMEVSRSGVRQHGGQIGSLK